MNIFDSLIVQPIFNALLIIYGFVGDFGLSIIIFTVIIRLLLWPFLKSQLRQTKLMRKVQPELKKIKAKTKGNKQLETQLMLELYKEKGIKPFSSIGTAFIQIPIFIGIYQVITIITQHHNQIDRYLYDFTKSIPSLDGVVSSSHQINEKLFGFVDLTQAVFSSSQLHIPLLILALLAGLFQFIQTKQIMPQSADQKRLRDILKEASQGKEADQSEITTAMGNKMMLFMPVLLVGFSFYLPGAVVLYYAVSSLVAIIQQHYILKSDEIELLDIADEKPFEKKGKNGTIVRIKKTQEPLKSSTKKQKRKRR